MHVCYFFWCRLLQEVSLTDPFIGQTPSQGSHDSSLALGHFLVLGDFKLLEGKFNAQTAHPITLQTAGVP